MHFAKVQEGQTLVSLARRYNLGYRAILRANPNLDIWLPPVGSRVNLTNVHILPPGSREGLVLNLSEMRLYFYPDEQAESLVTFPIGIGREGWQTPVTHTQVKDKIEAPTWFPPASIREEVQVKGGSLPMRVQPGPGNPLGAFAINLALPGYLLHGTNRPAGVGMRVSHGCIRLYPEDIASLFEQVKVGTAVRILDEPYKIGWRADQLWLEVHPPAYPETSVLSSAAARHDALMSVLLTATPEQDVELDWPLIKLLLNRQDGIPRQIGTRKAQP
ncbi:MAG: L,D-transpeptidase family protein [Pontibacterium sp.]